MVKTATSELLSCYIWFLETVYSAGEKGISHAEINRAWATSSVNNAKESAIADRTFFRWKDAASELFGVEIVCSSKGRYSVNVPDEWDRHQWIFNAVAISNMTSLAKATNDQNCIIFEEIPSGQQYLAVIMRAIQDKKYSLHIVYKGFDRTNTTEYVVSPFLLKVFKQRWYVVGTCKDKNEKLETRIFSLDRIEKIQMSDKPYSCSNIINPETYFDNIYGVSKPEKKAVTVKLKVSAKQANYFRTLPLHPSQKETRCNEGYSLFTFKLYPNFEFKKELLSYGGEVEVLAPASLRKEMMLEAQKMMKVYEITH